MKLDDISKLSVLANLLKESKFQLDVMMKKEYKKNIFVTVVDKTTNQQKTLDLELNVVFYDAIVDAMKLKIVDIENEIRSYGVEL